MFVEPIIAFLGLIVGFTLNRVVKEELEPGKKYFKILSLALLVVLIIPSHFNALVLVGAAIGVIISIAIKNPYLYLGLLTVISTFTGRLALISSLVFIFGLSYSSWSHRIINKRYLLESLLYFFIPLILLFSSRFLANYDLFLGVGIGGILGIISKNFKSF
ncbi:MAG: hypothetical protein J4472_01180 [DPANN group archaeon]|nr:hypothetical protein [DPANN group archaeon]MBS3153485.1 hypothetical protein [Candidatus Woesearchaeota archaeon]